MGREKVLEGTDVGEVEEKDEDPKREDNSRDIIETTWLKTSGVKFCVGETENNGGED